METVLYGDLFIAGNSLVNITIFIFVGKFLRKHINLCKYSIVSIGMSMLYLLAVYKNFVLSSIVSQLLIIIAGILLFKPKSIWETVILYLIIGLFSFLSVTIINVLIYYTGIKNGKIVIPIGILVSNAIINFSAKNLYKTKNAVQQMTAFFITCFPKNPVYNKSQLSQKGNDIFSYTFLLIIKLNELIFPLFRCEQSMKKKRLGSPHFSPS